MNKGFQIENPFLLSSEEDDIPLPFFEEKEENVSIPPPFLGEDIILNKTNGQKSKKIIIRIEKGNVAFFCPS